MGGFSSHPLGRSYPEASIFHFLPGTGGQQEFIQYLLSASSGTSCSGVLVGGEDGPASLGKALTLQSSGSPAIPKVAKEQPELLREREGSLPPRGVFQGWSVDRVLGQRAPGGTKKERREQSPSGRLSLAYWNAGGDSLPWPVQTMTPLPH